LSALKPTDQTATVIKYEERRACECHSLHLREGARYAPSSMWYSQPVCQDHGATPIESAGRFLLDAWGIPTTADLCDTCARAWDKAGTLKAVIH